MIPLKRLILLALRQCDGLPMPEAALLSAVKLLARPHRPTDDDVRAALSALEAAGYLTGAEDDIEGRQWTLTTRGTLRARQI